MKKGPWKREKPCKGVVIRDVGVHIRHSPRSIEQKKGQTRREKSQERLNKGVKKEKKKPIEIEKKREKNYPDPARRRRSTTSGVCEILNLPCSI